MKPTERYVKGNVVARFTKRTIWIDGKPFIQHVSKIIRDRTTGKIIQRRKAGIVPKHVRESNPCP